MSVVSRSAALRSSTLRSSVILLLLVIALTACTRERPVPEFLPVIEDTTLEANPEDTADAESSGTGDTSDTDEGNTDDDGTGEPQVQTDTPGEPTRDPDLDDPLGLGDEESPVGAEDGTPTPEDDRTTFDYTVQAGDTLTGLALRFDTDLETLRSLNALDSDIIAVGQPIVVPYIEGMTAEGAPTPTPGPFLYTVQGGDTLSGIAARFNTDPIRLAETNNLLDPNNLIVGSEILIPDYSPPAEVQTTPGSSGETTAGSSDDTAARFVHIVQPGEGLMEIASRYGIDMNTIVAANNLVNRNVLRVGQELVIPGITARDAAIRGGAVHIVQSGESLLGIALRYGVTVDEIIEFNEILDPNNISVGEQLIIPRN